MPSSVSSPDDRFQNSDPATAAFLDGGHRPRPGLRVAAVMMAMGVMSVGASAQDFSGTGSVDFDDGANWVGGLPAGFPDFGGGTIDFSGGDAAINVTDLILGVGGMTNSSNGDIVLGGTGSWTFDAGATIDPGSGSFTFDIDVTALGGLTFNLGSGDVVFNGAFDAQGGGTILANDGVVVFNGAVTSSTGTIWEGAGGGGFEFNDAFAGTGDQTFNLADGSATFNGTFDAIGGGTILANGGVVDFNGAVTSSSGTTWEGQDSGGFNFNDTFAGTGNQTFRGMTVGDEVFRFAGDATFTGSGADRTATFDSASVDFRSSLRIEAEDPNDPTGSSYTFALINDAEMTIADLQVNVETFTIDLGGDSSVQLLGDVEFSQANAALEILSSGSLSVSGNTVLSDSFRLLVAGDATVDWSGSITLGGTTLIDPDDPDAGENPNWHIDTTGAGDATVAITGAIIGDDETRILVTTDGTDDVSIDDSALGGFVGTIEVDDDSKLTFSGGGSGGGPTTGIGLSLGAGSEVMLGTLDTADNEFLFQSLDDTTVSTTDFSTASIRLDTADDATVVVRNGIFAGSFRDTNTGDLSVWWTQGETRYNGGIENDLAGGATIDGTWEVRNQGVHRLGTFEFDLDDDGTDDTIRASVNGISGFLVTQATAYLENADVSTDPGGSLELLSGATAAARLIIENTSTLSAQGDFSMNANSVLQITGESAAASGVNLTIGGDSTIDGLFEISADSDRTVDANDPATWIANASLDGAVTVGDTGTLRLSNTAYAIFGDALTSSGSIELQDEAYLDVVGTYTQTGGTSVFDAGTTFSAADIVLESGAVLELNDSNLNDATYAVLEIDNGIEVQEGATLFGSGEIAMAAGNLEYAGVVMAGAMGESEGLLHITSGDLISQEGGELHFGLTGDLAQAVSDGIGQSSIIQVDGTVDFTNSGALVVDVQGDSYIPTDLTFTLLDAGSFVNEDNIDLQAGAPSVTRTWNWGIDALGMLGDRVYAQSDADYTNTLTGNQIRIGDLLNSFIPDANADPNSGYGILLGQLDQIQTAEAYQTAIIGLEPTAQISAIQVTALGQYHEVLRRELRSRYAVVERRTPTPFRLDQPMQRLSADDTSTARTIRRASSPQSTAQGFGAFWARDLKTPTEGNVVGLDGKEFGGFGAFAWDLSESWVAGFDLGYSAFTGNLDRGYGNTRIGTLRGGGFATWSNGRGLFLDGALSAAWNHYDFTRVVPDTDLYATSNADGWQVDASIGGGYRMELQEGFAFTPMASLLYSYINTGEIDENSNTVAALAIDPGDLSAFIGRVGAGVSWSVLPGFVFDGEAGWQGNFTDNGDYNVGLSGLGADVPIEVKNQTINTAYYGVGVSWAPSSNIEVNLNWEGRSGDGLHSNMFYGGISISF